LYVAVRKNRQTWRRALTELDDRPVPPRPKRRTLLFLGLLILSSALMYAELALRFSQ